MRAKLFIAASVVLGALAVPVWLGAQAVAIEPVAPTVIMGGDVGFRVEGLRGSIPVGTLVVRVNGEWVEAEIASTGQPRRLSRR